MTNFVGGSPRCPEEGHRIRLFSLNVMPNRDNQAQESCATSRGVALTRHLSLHATFPALAPRHFGGALSLRGALFPRMRVQPSVGFDSWYR